MNENELRRREIMKSPRALFLIATVIFIVSIFVPSFHDSRPVGPYYDFPTKFEDDYFWSFMIARFMPEGYDTSLVELWIFPNTATSDDYWFAMGSWDDLNVMMMIYSRIGWLYFQILTAICVIIVLLAGITWKRIALIVALSSITLILATYNAIMLAEVLWRRIDYSFGFGLTTVSILVFFVSCCRQYTFGPPK